ncbi:MAG: DinB family protein [Beijerinckiaceae bacterium]
MIGTGYVQRMARYNRWQNENLYSAADRLSDEARRQERGAFFGSIHGTLNHLLWADEIWMSRFRGTPRPPGGIPDSTTLRGGWDELKRDRDAFDRQIIAWSDGLDDAWLAGELSYYSGAARRDLVMRRALLVMHLFNHQTHHRGQVHCMLTQAGVRPGDDTDLPFMERDQAA